MDFSNLVAQINSRFRSQPPQIGTAADDHAIRPVRHLRGLRGLVIRPRDAFVPSSRVASDAKPTAQPSQDTFVPQMTEPTEAEPTYSFSRKAGLNYKLKLGFDLEAVTMMARSYADGDLESIEEYAEAGFGFKGDFLLKGRQMIKSTEADPSRQGTTREISRRSMRQQGQVAYQDKNFQAEAFYKEALRVRSSMQETVRGGHRRAVNSLEVRYRLDNSFKFSFLSQFNNQTETLNTRSPEQLPAYFDNVEGLAQSASSEMMAGFFDTVQGYLDQVEEKMLAQTTQAFEQAAAELGFEGLGVEMTEANISSTIEGFFDRVGQALTQIESQFVAPGPEIEADVIEPDVITPPPPPEDIIKYYDPALELVKAQLASV